MLIIYTSAKCILKSIELNKKKIKVAFQEPQNAKNMNISILNLYKEYEEKKIAQINSNYKTQISTIDNNYKNKSIDIDIKFKNNLDKLENDRLKLLNNNKISVEKEINDIKKSKLILNPINKNPKFLNLKYRYEKMINAQDYENATKLKKEIDSIFNQNQINSTQLQENKIQKWINSKNILNKKKILQINKKVDNILNKYKIEFNKEKKLLINFANSKKDNLKNNYKKYSNNIKKYFKNYNPCNEKFNEEKFKNLMKIDFN